MKSLNQYIEENKYNTPILEASILDVGELENENDILVCIKDLINNEVIEVTNGGRTKEDDFNKFIKHCKINGNTVNLEKGLYLIIHIPNDPKFNFGFEFGEINDQVHYRVRSGKHCVFPVKYLPRECKLMYIECVDAKTIEFDLSKHPDKLMGNPAINFQNRGSQIFTKVIWNTNPINHLIFGVKVKDDTVFKLPKIKDFNPGKTGLNYFMNRAMEPKVIKSIFGPNCEIEKMI